MTKRFTCALRAAMAIGAVQLGCLMQLHAQLGPTEITPEWGWSGWHNPALMHPSGGHVWLGGLAGLNAQVTHSGPAFYDFASPEGVLDAQALLEGMQAKETLGWRTDVPLFALGFREEKRFEFRLASRFVAEQQLAYDRDLFALGVMGNGHPDLIGRRLDLSDMDLDVHGYFDHGLSVSAMAKEEKLWLGWGIHILNGISAFQTESFDAHWTTDSVDYQWTLEGGAVVQSAGVNLDTLAAGGEWEAPGNGGLPPTLGSGVAFDFGLLWRLTPKLDVEAAMQGRGSIRWLKSTQRRAVDPSAFILGGIDLVSEVQSADSLSLPDSLQMMVEDWANSLPDSLLEAFQVEGLDGPPAAFDTRSTETWRVGFRLRPTEQSELFAMGYRQVRFGEPSAGFLFGGVYRFGSHVAVHGQGQYWSGRWSWGGGLSLRGGPVRLAMSAQNVVGLILPLEAGHWQGRVSLGFEMGYAKDKKSRRKPGDLGTGRGMWH